MTAAISDGICASASAVRMVSRVGDPGDARAVLISITDEGRATLARVRADRGAAVDPYLDRLDDRQRQTLADAVVVLRELLAVARQSPDE